MDKNLVVLIILVSIYLIILLYVKIYPSIDFIHMKNYTKVILWYNGKNKQRLWVHLFNI